MYLHEYQAKNILKKYGIVVPKFFLVNSLNNIDCLTRIQSKNLVLKAQIHSGSRAIYGGIIFVNNNYNDLYNALSKLLGSLIATDQTLGNNKLVKMVLVEEKISFSFSFYVSIFLDCNDEKICFLFSKCSGSGIEKHDKNSFLKVIVDIFLGISNYHVIIFLKFLGLDFLFFDKAKILLNRFFNIFISHDLILLEINPLVLCNNEFVCLDAKIEVDDNAFFRQTDLFLTYDLDQNDFLENEAKKYDLNYISMSGNIGCIVNGAGLAMATMDVLILNGGMPANFLDIGGNATEVKVLNAIRVILMNEKVICLFVNIFGGIVKCDFIAKSIVNSIYILNIKIPIVVRLAGNMANEAIEILNEHDNVFCESEFACAIKKVISISRGNK